MCFTKKQVIKSIAIRRAEYYAGRRLQNATMGMDAKHPILLPAHHPFTQLVIAHEHQKHLHAGVQATLAAVRAKYWPLSARSSVKKYI